MPPCLRAFPTAFTLVEMMTVIGIIVIALAVAVPVVSSLEGNRSLAAGYNKVSAALGHAREIALYYRTPAGVVFFQDPFTGRQDAGYVMPQYLLGQFYPTYVSTMQAVAKAQGIAAPELPGSGTDPHFIDLIPGEEIMTFPQGVAVELVNPNSSLDGAIPSGGGTPTQAATATSIGYVDSFLRVGVVMFDQTGQLASTTSYWIAPYKPSLSTAGPEPYPASILGQTLGLEGKQPGSNAPQNTNIFYGSPSVIPGTTRIVPSLYCASALCIYDEAAYLAQTSSTGTGGSGATFNDGNNNSYMYGDLGGQSFVGY
ncbi:MAG TPA: hypothetical protein VL992_21075, partial [Tepidisphaeraceae bacterium]|nr:hypothetical protein [Tepidisphaeraceae bacterium]